MPLRWFALLVLACAPAAVLAQAKIDMQPTEAMVARLGVAYGTDKREAMRQVERSAATYNPLVLYALANALVEDYSERAIFWYHVGRIRAVYDSFRCRDKSAQNVSVPTVILAKTVKGWTLGPGVEARNITHQAKKLSEAELRIFRDRLDLPMQPHTA